MREREVWRRLRAGRPYKQIAFELGIAVNTATVLGSRARRKLGRTEKLAIPVRKRAT